MPRTNAYDAAHADAQADGHADAHADGHADAQADAHADAEHPDPAELAVRVAESAPARNRREERRAAIGFHVTMRLEDDRPIATSTNALRVIARIILEQGASRGLVAFGGADNHLHALLISGRIVAGLFARYAESALGWRLTLRARFERARIRPLQDQRHAYNAFHYVQRQNRRHGLSVDRWLEATSVPDLLGMRLLAGSASVIANVRTHLPRIVMVGDAQRPADGGPAEAEHRPLDLALLAEAAASAFAVSNLRGRDPDKARARRAAVHAAGLEARPRAVSHALELPLRTVQALRALAPDPTAIRAVILQARLRAAGNDMAKERA